MAIGVPLLVNIITIIVGECGRALAFLKIVSPSRNLLKATTIIGSASGRRVNFLCGGYGKGNASRR